ncbi:acetolactate synthase large subunit [Pseudonocardia spinosispora]|uniref:acetolactate synthase large subunit n=1 Tax=Pseudonocardia spinosispora TaxID=103441 RepID=UPI0003F89D8D|nr:acetolactate synthase large subunit [Pseudonocardia spinosispora]
MADELTGAESLVHTLVNNGIEVCFANPGTSEMHFVSALDRIDGIRPVLGLFEGVVTGAADGYARMTGQPAATLTHLGPGMANGLANLHNARKAQSPVVNVVGDHATGHQRFDAPLTADVEAFAQPVSHWVHAVRSARTVAADAARAVRAARTPPGQIATLILPADTAWSQAERPAPALPAPSPASVADTAVTESARALRRGRCALLLRGDALHGAGLRAAGSIAAATGARLVSDTFAPRVERGAGRAVVDRMPYRAADALRYLDDVETLILVGSQPPVAFFAYPDQPSELTPEHCTTLTLAHPHEDGTAALNALADAVGATGMRPPAEQCDRHEPLSSGPLDPYKIARLVSRHLPENAIISDEAITSSFGAYPLLGRAAPHDVLQCTGGAIGGGLPLATGAAIACPDRKVVSLEGDGSALYTLQALWTQAREHLDVLTIIYANRSYQVLEQELTLLGAGRPGHKAHSLLDLHNPEPNWLKLAEGMGVEAHRVDNVEALDKVLRTAMRDSHPQLIEAVI